MIMLKTANLSLSLAQNNCTSGEEQSSRKLITDEVSLIFQWIIYAVVCQTIDVLGTAGNIINIVCFVKQGFKDSVNISLLGLAVSDLGCLLTLVWLNLSFTLAPVFRQVDVSFDVLAVEYLTGAWPHLVFTRVTSWITALITMERCLCITMPLKVKTIVTPRRVCIIIFCVFIVLIGSATPVYCVNRLSMAYSSSKNRSILSLVYTEDRESVEKVSFAINNVFIPFTSFAIVLICTVTLVIKFQRKRAWRRTATSSENNSVISKRDQKISKMVLMISSLFIICFIPACICFVAMVLEPEFSIEGIYKNTFVIVFGLGFILESTNSSLNIFIYYRMSSRYRATLRRLLFCRGTDEESKHEVNVISKRSTSSDT